MRITAIKRQVKRTDRYSVFVEGKYAFSLSDSALLDSGLVNGQELSEAELKNWKRASADDKLYNNALEYATLRPRSAWEMEQYLRRKECEPTLADKILSKLSDMGLLDDEAFARSWVANRRLLKPTSRRKLLQELRAKRVSDDVADLVLGEDPADERTVLAELVARKRRQSRYQDDQKLMQYLAGQGFNYGDIKAVLSGSD
ncbi:MAG TPA: RecX family transcriptional regulator [Candidatus Saccharimonadales bacterium]|nr:RecX family transcriptional regulator [Candidatus Saccharimonadales bacterium]